MSCLEGIIQFDPDGEESECSTVHSEGQASDQVQEDILGDPEGEDDESEDEDPGTIEENETDNSASDENDTVTVGAVHYAVTSSKRRSRLDRLSTRGCQGSRGLPRRSALQFGTDMTRRIEFVAAWKRRGT